MICCVVAAYFILKYVMKWQRVKEYLGIEEAKQEEYGWTETGELDAFKN